MKAFPSLLVNFFLCPKNTNGGRGVIGKILLEGHFVEPFPYEVPTKLLEVQIKFPTTFIAMKVLMMALMV